MNPLLQVIVLFGSLIVQVLSVAAFVIVLPCRLPLTSNVLFRSTLQFVIVELQYHAHVEPSSTFNVVNVPPPASTVTVLADDPLAVVDIPHMCGEEGHDVESVTRHGGHSEFRIRRSD